MSSIVISGEGDAAEQLSLVTFRTKESVDAQLASLKVKYALVIKKEEKGEPSKVKAVTKKNFEAFMAEMTEAVKTWGKSGTELELDNVLKVSHVTLKMTFKS